MSNIINLSRGKAIDREFDTSDLTEGACDTGSDAYASKVQPPLGLGPITDWTNQELATLYRAKRLLSDFASLTGTDRGLTDDGSPWFVFCDCEGEVLVHIARIDGIYILDGVGLPSPLKGHSFDDMIGTAAKADGLKNSEFRSAVSNILKLSPRKQTKIFIHPAANFAALIWAAATLDQVGDPWAEDTDEPAPEDAAMASSRAFDPNPLTESASDSSAHLSDGSVTNAAALVALENSIMAGRLMDVSPREEQAHGDDFHQKIAFFNVVLGVFTSIIAINGFQSVIDPEVQEILDELVMSGAVSQDGYALPAVSIDNVMELINLNVAMVGEAVDVFLAQRLVSETEVISESSLEVISTKFVSTETASIAVESRARDNVATLGQEISFPEGARSVSRVDLSSASANDGSISKSENPSVTAAANGSGGVNPDAEASLSLTALSIVGVFGLVISDSIDAKALNFLPVDSNITISTSATNLDAIDLGTFNGESSPISVTPYHLTYTVPDTHMWDVIGEFLASQETVTAIEDGNLLIIDRSVMPYNISDVHVVTWEFHDGSSVSIVGTSSDILNLDLVA